MMRSRRSFLAATAATLLYGARRGFAGEARAATGTRLALLLPLSSQAFGRPADSVRQGFAAAAQRDAGAAVDIVVYSTSDDPANVAAGYDQALAEGARLIAGPLTRNGVASVALRAQPGTPVLALNVPENDAALPRDFYAFSLQVETEARQVARMAYAEGRRSALTLGAEQPLVRRIHRAFSDEFTRRGGRVSAEFVYRTTTADLMALREAAGSGQSDMVFLALDAGRARVVRGYLDGPVQVYATSQVLEGAPDRVRDAQLNGIRFVGMPWLLQPDHSAVMVYARAGASPPPATDFERLYAFGIDAYRIAVDLLRGGEIARIPLDGVTGRVSLAPDRHFVRELVPAQFVDGIAVPLGLRS
ncbi:MAG: penicillin-binding protein activator [Burkholderiales bacterium]|nr:penicillin-binding protein activator [Burkholderiales bacterium]